MTRADILFNILALGALAQAGPTPSSKWKPRQALPDLDIDLSKLPTYNGTGPTMLRFGCRQLSIDRIDPLVNPGAVPSPHQHQIVGGDAFDASMPLSDIAAESSCTTCSYSDDFSNYWTSNLYFRARNGTYHRVPQIAPGHNSFFNDTFSEQIGGGMVVYYVSPGQNQITSFPPGFRMFVGDPMLRSVPGGQWNLSTQTCFRCFNGPNFGGDEFRPCVDPRVDTMHLPDGPCFGIRSNILFPTCWDGVNLDSANHKSHVAYPVEGPHLFDGIGTAETCPPSHPVKIPQVMVEAIWDTTAFNDPNDWPEDGSQPFVLSTGDRTGYSQHADYVFGWKNDALDFGMEAGCAGARCPGMATQSLEEASQCSVPELVGENYSGWLETLPGNPPQPPVTTGIPSSTTTAAPAPTSSCPPEGKGKGKGKGKRNISE
ncbi:hypothetical protein QBC42DRAFT_236063 [Cladorrhinum samala]|uniref:DUF1996 domain-containing protein n=1 Tax=Cladorrhinum samala TaxID=585594 RepID=A0AAV9HAB6_9PEZI|nr:hypothetical protein QBC42DRAFT_236063 [Cladorrhinum samala]